MSNLSEQAQNLLQLIPESASIGNVTLRKLFGEEFFAVAKTELLNAGVISLGRGKGGSVRRTVVPAFAENYARPETGQIGIAATEEF